VIFYAHVVGSAFWFAVVIAGHLERPLGLVLCFLAIGHMCAAMVADYVDV
jgi:hypothetical protein